MVYPLPPTSSSSRLREIRRRGVISTRWEMGGARSASTVPRRHEPVFLLLVAILGVLLAPAACRQEPASVETQHETPHRLISLAPSITEMLFELEVGHKLVGVTRYCDYPVAASDIPKVGGFNDPSVEAILGLRPDLLLTVKSPANRRAVERLRKLGVQTLVVEDYTLDQVMEATLTVGRAVGAETRARELVARTRREVDEITARVSARETVRVLLVYGHKPLVAAGRGTYADEMLTLAGGRNVLEDGEGARYPMLGMETVLRLAPEVMIDASMGMDETAARAFWARWPEVPAVRDGRVVLLSRPELLRPGPRVARGLALLARSLHPDAGWGEE